MAGMILLYLFARYYAFIVREKTLCVSYTCLIIIAARTCDNVTYLVCDNITCLVHYMSRTLHVSYIACLVHYMSHTLHVSYMSLMTILVKVGMPYVPCTYPMLQTTISDRKLLWDSYPSKNDQSLNASGPLTVPRARACTTAARVRCSSSAALACVCVCVCMYVCICIYMPTYLMYAYVCVCVYLMYIH